MKWVRVYYKDTQKCASYMDTQEFRYKDNHGRNWFDMLQSFYDEYGEHVVIMADVVIAKRGVEAFEKCVREYPDEIVCAPVMLYPVTTGLSSPVWEPRHLMKDSPDGEGPRVTWWVRTGDRTTDLFGGSCYHMPRKVWDSVKQPTIDLLRRTFRWRDDEDGAKDAEYWLGYMAYRRGWKVRVAWEAQTIHLHY